MFHEGGKLFPLEQLQEHVLPKETVQLAFVRLVVLWRLITRIRVNLNVNLCLVHRYLDGELVISLLRRGYLQLVCLARDVDHELLSDHIDAQLYLLCLHKFEERKRTKLLAIAHGRLDIEHLALV